MTEREFARSLDPRLEGNKQLFDIAKLVADSRVHGQVGIAREVRFAPALDGDAADEAETPVMTPAELLDLLCGFEQPVRGVHEFASAQKEFASRPGRSSPPAWCLPATCPPVAACRTSPAGTPTATATRVPRVAALRAGARSRAMLQRALSDARARVSESPSAKFGADGAIQTDLRSSESAGAEPAMRRATAGSLRTLAPQRLLLRADEVIQ